MKHSRLAAVTVLAAIALAGCSSSGSHHAGPAASSGRAVASSALANPTVSADISQLENELLTAWQSKFTPVHPIKSSEAAIMVVFPSGDVKAIAAYAVHSITPAMLHGTKDEKVAARKVWAQAVVANALKSNPNATLPPGSANIPGTTSSPSPSAS